MHIVAVILSRALQPKAVLTRVATVLFCSPWQHAAVKAERRVSVWHIHGWHFHPDYVFPSNNISL